MIPRILHQVWVGPKPLPEEYAAYVETWRRLHPDWEHRMWTEDDLPETRRPESIDPIRSPIERCDLLRLEVLWRYGGVYVDTDFECLRPIDELIDGHDFVTAYLKPGRVNHAFMGSTLGHPLVGRALEVVKPRTMFGYDKASTGPEFFNRVMSDWNADGLTVLDRELIYPETPGEREQAYAIHHMARTWKDAEGFRKSALKAEQRLDDERRSHAETKRRLARVEAELTAARAGKGRLRQLLAGVRR